MAGRHEREDGVPEPLRPTPGRVAYGVLFVVLLPLFLLAWARGTEGIVALPRSAIPSPARPSRRSASRSSSPACAL